MAAPFAAAEDPVPRRIYAALLVWLAPIALVWASQRPDEVRLLAPAWPAFALLAAAALTSASLALFRLHPAAAHRAGVALAALIALANVVSVDGLGRHGLALAARPRARRAGATGRRWRTSPTARSRTTSRSLARTSRDGEQIVSSDGRLLVLLPRAGRGGATPEPAASSTARASSRSSRRARASSSPSSKRQPTDPISWIQCAAPVVSSSSGEQAGIYAAFVVGAPPARAPTPEDCRIVATPGDLLDAVFGSDLALRGRQCPRDARPRRRASRAPSIERTGCSTFRVVVTGDPGRCGRAGRLSRDRSRGSGCRSSYEAASRYPEVSARYRTGPALISQRVLGRREASPPSPPATRSARARPLARPRRAAAGAPRPRAASRSRLGARAGSRGGTSEPGHAVLDRVEQAADGSSRPPAGRAPSPRARPRRSPRGGRADDDGRPLVVRAELARRDEADRVRNAVAERPVADDRRAASLRSPRAARGSPSPPRAARRTGRAAARPARRPRRESRRRSGRRARLVRRARARPRPAPRRGTERCGPAGRALRAAHRARARELDVRAPELQRRTASGLRARAARTGASARGRGRRPARHGAPRESTTRGTAGATSAFHGRRLRFPTIPCP